MEPLHAEQMHWRFDPDKIPLSMETADLLLTNGHVITLDDHHPRATAMAIKDGKILALGSDAELKHYSSPTTRYINLENKTIVPGFIDSHIHLFAYGDLLLRQADLVGSTSIDDILSRLRQLQNRRPTGWLQGHGFDNDKLREKQFPTAPISTKSPRLSPSSSPASAATPSSPTPPPSPFSHPQIVRTATRIPASTPKTPPGPSTN